MSAPKSDRIHEMIRREKALLEGAKSISASTSNATVLQQCRSKIRDSQANIAYLEKELQKLDGEPEQPPANVTGLELLRYDNPFMGQRIQFMLQQLEYKLSLAKQYKEGIEKLQRLYSEDHDKQNRDTAAQNLAESTAKIELLRYALKRYTDLQFDANEVQPLRESARRPVTGTLHLNIVKIDGVDHTTLSASRNVETRLQLKIENQLVGEATAMDDVFNQQFEIPIEKANELELVAYDQAGSASKPVAILWIRINDVVEALRRKGVQSRVDKGWANADTVIREGSVAPAAGRRPPRGGSGSPGSSPGSTGTNAAASASGSGSTDSIEGWFILEPAGRVYLKLQFDKNTPVKKTYRDGLGRHNAIVRKQEDATEVMGHQFVHQRFYNIMRCAMCEEFMTLPFQCVECNFACHKHCVPKVVTKCITQTSNESEQFEQLNHRIPHSWEPSSNRGANWCCHCGLILPFGKKKTRKCVECGIMCHTSCMTYVPNFCGMSMEMAAQILSAIRLTKYDQKKRIALSNPSPVPYTDGKRTHAPQVSAQPPPTSRRVPRKKVPEHSKTASEDSDQKMELALDLGSSSWWGSKKGSSEGAGSADTLAGSIATGSTATGSTATGSIATGSTATGSTATGSTATGSTATGSTATASTGSTLAPEPPQSRWPVLEPLSAKAGTSANEFAPVLPEPASGRAQGTTGAAAAPEHTPEQVAEQLLSGSKAAPSVPSVPSAPSVPAERRRKPKVCLDDFSFLTVLGKGNFGKVMLAESKHTKKLYAIKVLKKNFIIENREVESTRSEKNVFLIANKENHPFLINLYACFQTANRIYFVMDYVSGGDLMYHIQMDLFAAGRAQFYAAEVLLGLKQFHDNNVIYRDLKLDNILLTLDGHIKIADYGLCKENMGYGKTTGTFCGTPDFIAPEILLDQKYGHAVDWWALGVLMYQMLLGKSPFRGKDEDEVYDAILSDEPLYPIHMPKDSVSILQQLLERDPAKRLGSGPRDALEIMEHPYFANINFDKLLALEVTPPYKPSLSDPRDVSYFDKLFTSEMPALTPMNSVLAPNMQEQFRGFSYVNPEFT